MPGIEPIHAEQQNQQRRQQRAAAHSGDADQSADAKPGRGEENIGRNQIVHVAFVNFDGKIVRIRGKNRFQRMNKTVFTMLPTIDPATGLFCALAGRFAVVNAAVATQSKRISPAAIA
jgi:hypothetical protein